MICDLDVLLLIESQYSFSNLLLNLQKTNRVNNFNFEVSEDETENETDDDISFVNQSKEK